MKPLRLVAGIASGAVTVVALGTLTICAARNRVHHPGSTAVESFGPRPLAHYGELPLSFEANAGQADSRVQFLSRGHGYTLMLSAGEALLALKQRDKNSLPAGRFEPRRTSAPVLDMRLAGANPQATFAALDELPGRSNYLLGNDPSRWKVGVKNYGAVRYDGLYPGINLFYYGNQGRLEYDFVVAPGADAASIGWSFRSRGTGSRSTLTAVRRIDANGELVLGLDGSEIRFGKPTAYQWPREVPASLVMARSGRTFSGPQRTSVESRWVIGPHGRVGFEIGTYDRSRPLVIDPPLVYSTFLGGSGQDEANAIAVDGAGNAYVTGTTESIDFPLKGSPVQTLCMDCAAPEPNVFVSKLNADGSALVYSTYLGGTGYSTGYSGDQAFGIQVDAQGDAYLAGVTDSFNFPVTTGAWKTDCPSCRAGSTNAFVTKLNPTGSGLVFSTYLGGSGNFAGVGDWARALAVDRNGDIYVTGQTYSADFYTTSGAYQSVCKDCSGGTGVAFLVKLKADGSTLLYSTMLGGTNVFGGGGSGDTGFAIAVDASGNAFVAGEAHTRDFPTSLGAWQMNNKAGTAGFVTKFNTNGSAFIFSTLLSGTANDSIYGIAIDAAGSVYVAGTTTSPDFPFTTGAFQTNCADCALGSSGFVTKFKSDGSALLFSTFLGGSGGGGGDQANGIAIDSNGNSYVVGKTSSSTFPTTTDARQTQCDQTTAVCFGDAFVTELNASGSSLIYSTYLGGGQEDAGTALALDSANNIYLTGYTVSPNFPVTTGAFQTTCGANCMRPSSSDPIPYDAFVAKFGTAVSAPAPTVTLTPTSIAFGNQTVGSATSPQPVTLSNTGNAALASLAISIAGANSGDFTETNSCGATLAAGASCSISVTFTPSASGSRTASVQISDNAASSPQTVPLTGSGTAGSPAVTLAPTSIAFGNQAIGSASSPQLVTLTNTGNATLSSLAISIAGANSGDFTDTNTCGATLAAGASCSISVTFTPSASGSRTASVQISDNAASSPQTVPLTGSGTTGSPAVTLAPTSIAFGNQAVGSATSPQPVTLTNTGNATLSSLAITIAGTNSGDFTDTNTCGATLAAGASCSISVTFTPSASGSRTASVQISDNAASSPQTVPLTGSGTSGLGLAPAPGSSSTVTINSGSTASYSLSLGGAGFSGTVTLTCSGAPPDSTCSVPGSVTVSATTSSTVQVSVATTTYTAAQLERPFAAPFIVGAPVLALLFLPRRIRRNVGLEVLGLLAIAVTALSLSGCGGGAPTVHSPTGTPPGQYSLTVSASGGSLTATTQLTLVVH